MAVALDTSPKVSDEVRKTTCYMCACRCGINVHMKDGQVAYIEGNKDHPVNRGVLCAKGSSGIMQHLSPARLRAPMKRVGPRGSGEFEEITWEEALETAVAWLKPLRETDQSKLAFFTWDLLASIWKPSSLWLKMIIKKHFDTSWEMSSFRWQRHHCGSME